MEKRVLLREKPAARCAIAFLLFIFSAVVLWGIPGMKSMVYASSIPEGAFDPDKYQGTTYMIHGNQGSYTTGEINKLYTNIFYYKDKIIVEDTDINAHQSGSLYTFNIVSYDATETVSSGFATLKTLEDKKIVKITKGTILGDTLSGINGLTTIREIEFINPNYIVILYGSLSNSNHPGFSGSGSQYSGIVSCIDHVGVYSTTCDLIYSYVGNESDYLWQDGKKSQLPEKLYAPMPAGSYKFIIPFPANTKSGYYTSCSVDIGMNGNNDRFCEIASIEYDAVKPPTYLTEKIGTVVPFGRWFTTIGKEKDGSKYNEGSIQILGSSMNVEFDTYAGATVNFHQNGGTIQGIADGSDSYVVPVQYSKSYTAAEIDALVSTPSRAGYQFAGWGFKNPGNYSDIEFGEYGGDYTEIQEGYYQASSYKFTNSTPPHTLDMYALWTAEENSEKTDLSKKGTATVKNQVYTGKALKPAVTVMAGTKTLVEGTDYTVSYKNNKAIGTASVIVKGKGNYTGTLKKTFKINPKPVSKPSLKAGKKKLTLRWKKSSGITGYEIQYSLNKKFSKKTTKKVIVTKAKTVKKVIKNLNSRKMYYVRIRAYKTVSKVKYYSAWSKTKKAKTK